MTEKKLNLPRIDMPQIDVGVNLSDYVNNLWLDGDELREGHLYEVNGLWYKVILLPEGNDGPET